MSESKEVPDESEIDQVVPIDAEENMDIQPGEIKSNPEEPASSLSLATGTTSGDSADLEVAEGSSNVRLVDRKVRFKMELLKPSRSSENKSAMRISWEQNEGETSEDDKVRSMSMSAVLNVPQETMVDVVNSFLEESEEFTKEMFSVETQTSPISPLPDADFQGGDDPDDSD